MSDINFSPLDVAAIRDGDRMTVTYWNGPAMPQIVACVDRGTGRVTFRDPTRWERFTWWLSTPLRKVRMARKRRSGWV